MYSPERLFPNVLPWELLGLELLEDPSRSFFQLVM